MKILQICHKPPFPAVDGGCIAIKTISEGLLARCQDLKIFSIVTPKHPFVPEAFPEQFLERTRFEAVYVDTGLNVVDAFSALITQDSYNISRFFTPDVDTALIRILESETFDIIHLESLFTTPYIATIRRFSKAKIVLRSHNLEYIIWERMAAGSGNKLKKIYLKMLSQQLKKYEQQVMDQVDGIVAISNDDTERHKKLGLNQKVITVPFGIDLKKYEPAPVPAELAVFHLGSMDWMPNQEGLMWFLNAVWPKVLDKLPELKFYMAGRNIPPDFSRQVWPNVVIVGEVANAQDFMNSKAIMVVPLLSAGGIRVKIIEAMALEKAIISTSVGAEGIAYVSNSEILIADTAEKFAKAIIALAQNRKAVEDLGKNARRLAEQHFSNEVLTQKLVAFYKEVAGV